MSTEKMNSVRIIFDRVKKMRGFKKDTELAKWLGVSKQTLSAWESRENIANVDVFTDRGFTELWIRTGEGPIFSGSDAHRVQFDDSVTPVNDDFILVPRYAISGSAGAGALVDKEEVIEYLSFRKEWVKNSLRVKEGSLAVIGVIGDSMEPRLRDGDVVLLDMSHQAIEDNAIYALQFNGGLSIKRVQRFMSGSVEIISDNPRYKTETLTPDQAEGIKVIGRVVWAGGKV